MRTIWEAGKFRIVEVPDVGVEMDDLKGDVFNPKVNSDMDPEKLQEEERQFEELVRREGVFGYVLERWNSATGTGWEYVDSCFGFVGQYTPTEEAFNHYIVEELKSLVTKRKQK